MAIQGSYNLDNALTSQSYAYKCWYNYNYGNNTMGISASDMGEITQTWSGELSNWRATASDDENAYEIEDDDFSKAYDSGKDTAKEKTGYEGGKSNAGVAIDAGLGAAAVGVTGAGFIIGGGFQSIGAYATAGYVVAAAAKYHIAKPNEEQKKACDELQDEMENANSALTAAQGDMSAMSDEIIELSDEAAIYNEDANEDIEEKKAEYKMYKASYDALMAKVEAGETLTEDEKALLQELVPLMQELGVGINATSEDTTDAVGDIYDEMGTYQEGYDNAAATIGEVQGLTDYAESFDEATKRGCNTESAAQSLNTVAGLAAGGTLIATGWLNIPNMIMGAASIVAAGVCGVAAKEQADWAGQVETEIDARRATQDLNSDTTDIYDESIDGYEGSMTIVDDMTMEIPEDIEEMTEGMEIPEEAPVIPEDGGAAAPAAAGLGIPPQNEGGNGNNSGLGTSPDSKDDEDKDKP